MLNRIYETRFCNDKLLVWTRNVGGLLFATRLYDIVTSLFVFIRIYMPLFKEIITFVYFEFLHGHIQNVNVFGQKNAFKTILKGERG